ncbi:hypothetical protein, partial [Burkholderia thailandensis]|uniref:hypothetical protein n=1 Tax=Burkholderia thailandensis TaxID=57975 RepID=UPI001CA47BCD
RNGEHRSRSVVYHPIGMAGNTIVSGNTASTVVCALPLLVGVTLPASLVTVSSAVVTVLQLLQ